MEAGNPLNLIQRLLQGVPVIQIAMERQRRNRPALIRRDRHANLAAKLILLVDLALADTLNMRLMYRIQLVPVLSLLAQESMRQGQEFPEIVIDSTTGLSLDVLATHPR